MSLSLKEAPVGLYPFGGRSHLYFSLIISGALNHNLAFSARKHGDWRPMERYKCIDHIEAAREHRTTGNVTFSIVTMVKSYPFHFLVSGRRMLKISIPEVSWHLNI